MDQGDALRVMPEDDAIARAIASVPGVAKASIVRPRDGGRSRLTLRLHPGEDDQRVAWAVAATLRERFDIDLDPEAIRPRMASPTGPDHDPVAVVRTDEADAATPPSGADAVADDDAADDDVAQPRSPSRPQAAWPPRDRPWTAREPLAPATDTPEPTSPFAGHDTDPATTAGQPIQLTTTRERLSRAVEDALAELVRTSSDAGVDDVAAATPSRASTAAAEAREAEPEPEPATITPEASDPEPGTVTVELPATGVSASSATAPPTAPVTSDPAALRPPRAVIEHLEVRRGLDSVEVTVTLRHATHTVVGSARAVATSKGRMRATAEATVAAVHALVRTSLVVGVDRIVLTDGGDDVTVSVVLTMVTAGDEQRLLGGAIVRDDTDAEGAVVRATLDALNRRVVPLLAAR